VDALCLNEVSVVDPCGSIVCICVSLCVFILVCLLFDPCGACIMIFVL
jgi:hypothetical protein